MNKCVAIVLSGGVGTRFGGDAPKQYYVVNGKPVIGYSLTTLAEDSHVDGIVVVADEKYHELIEELLPTDKFLGFAEPGDNRQLSICSGLDFLQGKIADDTLVMIHDGARPFLSHELIERCVMAADGHDGVMPILPMTDTIYKSIDGKVVSELVNRSELYAGQSPEIFYYRKYVEANNALGKDEILKINGSTEVAVRGGLDIAMVPGDKANIKITTPDDLKYFDMES